MQWAGVALARPNLGKTATRAVNAAAPNCLQDGTCAVMQLADRQRALAGMQRDVRVLIDVAHRWPATGSQMPERTAARWALRHLGCVAVAAPKAVGAYRLQRRLPCA